MTAQLLTTVVLIVYLAGCTESYSLFSPLEPESAVELSAPAAGAILPSGAEFALALQYPPDTSANERASSLIVELRSVSGDLIATVSFDADALSRPTLPPITLPALDPGVYELHYRARAANGDVINERRQLFIAADPIRISNVFVYPPVAEVRSQAIAQAEFVYTAEHQPYVVWTLGTRRVAAGYLVAGFDGVVLDTGNAAGVFQLTVEVYPFGPDEGADVTVGAPVRRAVELVVAEQRRLSATDYLPADFTLLYSFAGNYRNSAPGAALVGVAYDAGRIGTPQLQVRDELFGYAVNELDGIELPVSLLPGPDSQLYARFRGWVADLETDGELWRSESLSGERLVLALADGYLTVQYRATATGTDTVQRLSQMTGHIVEGALKVVRVGEELRFVWYARGSSVALTVPRALNEAAVAAAHTAGLIWLPGYVRLGSAPGTTVIWDEFGIQAPQAGLEFVRQSIAEALRQTYGELLVSAVLMPEAEERHELDLSAHGAAPPVLQIQRVRGDHGGFELLWIGDDDALLARMVLDQQQLRFGAVETPLVVDFTEERFEIRWNGVDPQLTIVSLARIDAAPVVLDLEATSFTPRALVVSGERAAQAGLISAALVLSTLQ